MYRRIESNDFTNHRPTPAIRSEEGRVTLSLIRYSQVRSSFASGYSRTDSNDPGGTFEGEDPTPGQSPLMPRSFELGREMLSPGQHPFSSLYAARAPMLQFDPDIYLDPLV